MLLLMALFFATRINKAIPNYCSQSYLEGDLALNDGYIVAAVFNRNWPNTFWTISIFASNNRGHIWNHVKDLMGTFSDGWVMDTSEYMMADPSVSIMGDNPNGFYLIGLAYSRTSPTSRMIVFCIDSLNPRVASNWECYNMHRYNPTRRDKPWVMGVPGSSRVIGAWMKEDTVFILTNDNHGAPGDWVIRKRIFNADSRFNLPYLTYHDGVFYIAVEERTLGNMVNIHVLYSTDNGTTWNEVPSIAARFYRRATNIRCDMPTAGFKKNLKSISAFGINGLAVAYVYGNDRSDTGRCNVYVSYSFDGGITWIDSAVYRSDSIQGNPVLSSSGDTLLLFFVERVRSDILPDTSMVMYGWMEGGVWRNRRIASAWGYHPDMFPACHNKQGNDYASLITYRDTVYYYTGGDRSRDGYIFSGGGNAWFFRGIVSEITGVEEVVKEGEKVAIRVVKGGLEVPEYGEVYSVSGRLIFKGGGRVSLPSGVYFVRAGGKVFKVVVR